MDGGGVREREKEGGRGGEWAHLLPLIAASEGAAGAHGGGGGGGVEEVDEGGAAVAGRDPVHDELAPLDPPEASHHLCVCVEGACVRG